MALLSMGMEVFERAAANRITATLAGGRNRQVVVNRLHQFKQLPVTGADDPPRGLLDFFGARGTPAT